MAAAFLDHIREHSAGPILFLMSLRCVMIKIQIICPGCKTALQVPDSAIGKKGRCATCSESFLIAPPVEQAEEASKHAPDDTIMGWLDEAVRNAPDPADSMAGDMASLGPRRGFPIHLDHVDSMGAFFHFNSSLLYDTEFRSSFPQRCIVCGSRQSLSIHLIVWSGKLQGGNRKEQPIRRSPFVLELDTMQSLRGPDLLGQLPRVENVPEPYCLPFPYFICRKCSAVGTVVTEVHVDPEGNGEECELGISSLRQAEKFALAVCGPDDSGPKEIRRARKERKGDPWKALPLAIRVRIQRWFTPDDGEKFVAYIPDADYSKAEAGLAGLVLTDQRLIYHKSVAQTEFPLAEHLTLTPRKAGSRTHLEIKSESGKTAKLSTQASTADDIQRLIQRAAK